MKNKKIFLKALFCFFIRINFCYLVVSVKNLTLVIALKVFFFILEHNVNTKQLQKENNPKKKVLDHN